jgi:alginate O-acetyltransferase complex protein AlgI
MLFNSYEFIFCLLPASVLGFFIFGAYRAGAARLLLIAFSIVFYASWDPSSLPIVLISGAFNFCVGRALVAARTQRLALLCFGLVVNLLALFAFKYWAFFWTAIEPVVPNELAKLAPSLPLGISFFTFTQIAFLADAYARSAREYGVSNYFLFILFFPHLIAGPIIHHREMMPQFEDKETYRLKWHNISLGLTLFSIGLAKKVILADNLSEYASFIFASSTGDVNITFAAAWIAALSYTFQIYFDFSGYTDMALGAALLFGIRLPVNFNSPYQADSIIEFWRRWHMTLSRFLRDYLYIPLGGNRLGHGRRYVNLLVTMILGGLWHGAAWTFVVWGALHGFYLLVNHAWRSLGVKLPRALATAITFLCCVIAWVFFRAESLSSAWRILRGMAGLNGFELDQHHRSYFGPFAPVLEHAGIVFKQGAGVSLVNLVLVLGCLGICLWMPNSQRIVLAPTPSLWRASAPWAVATAVLLAISIASISMNSEFIYFNF